MTAQTDLTIDDVRYELLTQIRQLGLRIETALTDMENNAKAARRSLQSGERPYGPTQVNDDPVQLLRDMEPLCELARNLGIGRPALLKARRGGFVPGGERE